jgi:hypothetical protein
MGGATPTHLFPSAARIPIDESTAVDQRPVADHGDPLRASLVDEVAHAGERADAVHDPVHGTQIEGTNRRVAHRDQPRRRRIIHAVMHRIGHPRSRRRSRRR